MKAFDSKGKEIELSVSGWYEDDIEIDDIYYIESEEEVPESEVEFIYERYSDSIYEAWLDKQIRTAEDSWEGDRWKILDLMNYQQNWLYKN